MIFYIINAISEYSISNKKVDLLTKANILASFAADSGNEDELYSLISLLEVGDDIRVIYLDRDAKVTFDTADTLNQKGKILAIPQILNSLDGKNSTEKWEENDKLYLNVSVPVSKVGEIQGAILLKASIDDIDDYYSHVRNSLFIISLLSSVLIGFFSYLLSGVFTSPLINLTAKIKEMSETDSRKPVEIKGSTEVTELVSAFNTMVLRIDDLDNRRHQFVSNASHELKTPLSSIKLICDSLLQNPDTDREMVNEFLTDMNEQVDRLTRIINKLLSLTKLDSSSSEAELFDFTTLNLKTLTYNVIKALLPLAQQKNILLQASLHDDVFIRADSDKIWEAIYNVLDNSIKYTPEDGKVTVDLCHDEKNVYITISDTGIGIKETEFNKIFDRFYRVDKARARDTGGTGLGLSIALSSVELHGGYIEVESRENEGSTFRIILPKATNL